MARGEEMGPGYYLTRVTHELLFVLSMARDDKKLRYNDYSFTKCKKQVLKEPTTTRPKNSS